MHTGTSLRGDVTRASHEQFLDLICADNDLLQAEFDAIIADQWPTPPPREPRRDNPSGRHPNRRAPPAPPGPDGVPLPPPHPGVPAWSRQRSPPPPTEMTDRKPGDAH